MLGIKFTKTFEIALEKSSSHLTILLPDETFQIHRNPNKRNRVINDTIFEESPPKKKNTAKSNEAVFKKPKKRKLCNFLDDECEASDGSSDEFDKSSDAELDSIICNEEEHDDTSVDMRAIYLQSVK